MINVYQHAKSLLKRYFQIPRILCKVNFRISGLILPSYAFFVLYGIESVSVRILLPLRWHASWQAGILYPTNSRGANYEDSNHLFNQFFFPQSFSLGNDVLLIIVFDWNGKIYAYKSLYSAIQYRAIIDQKRHASGWEPNVFEFHIEIIWREWLFQFFAGRGSV